MTEHVHESTSNRKRNRSNPERNAEQAYKLDAKADRATIKRICRQGDRPQDPTIVRGNQIAHLRKVFAGRIADHLYKTEPDRDHVIALIRVLASVPNIRSSVLTKNACRWLPSATKAEIDDLVSQASRRPCVFRKETLGVRIRLTDAERQKYKAWSIWPIDLSLAESKLREKEHDRDRKAKERKEAGATPRSESLSRTRPWVAEGISRSTWERRRRTADANSSGVLKSLYKEKMLIIETIAPDDFASAVSTSNVQPAFADLSGAERLQRDGGLHGHDVEIILDAVGFACATPPAKDRARDQPIIIKLDVIPDGKIIDNEDDG